MCNLKFKNSAMGWNNNAKSKAITSGVTRFENLIRSARKITRINPFIIILVELFHKGEAVVLFFAIFSIIQFLNKYFYIYGQIPGVIALKNPEKRLHHWLEISIMIIGIMQNKIRNNNAMRVTKIHAGRFFILSGIVFPA